MLVQKLVEMEFMVQVWHQLVSMIKLKKKNQLFKLVIPFTEKLLLEACLELMAGDSIIAIQDMGAAGLTSSSIEMASKGNLGIEINLNKVPCREAK